MEENKITPAIVAPIVAKKRPSRAKTATEVSLKPIETKQVSPAIIKELNQDQPKQLSLEEQKRERLAQARARLRREWEMESQKVSAVFRDLEVGPGGNLKFSARKYPWDQIEDFNFKDGHTYEVPLWVYNHINDNCKFPAYRHNIDPNAKSGETAKQEIGRWNHRFAFIAKDFTPIAKPEEPPHIIQLASY